MGLLKFSLRLCTLSLLQLKAVHVEGCVLPLAASFKPESQRSESYACRRMRGEERHQRLSFSACSLGPSEAHVPNASLFCLMNNFGSPQAPNISASNVAANSSDALASSGKRRFRQPHHRRYSNDADHSKLFVCACFSSFA